MANRISVDLSAERETISDAINKVSEANQILQGSLDEVDKDFKGLAKSSDVTEDQLQGIARTSREVSSAKEQASNAASRLRGTLNRLEKGVITTSQAQEKLDESLEDMTRAQWNAATAGNRLEDQLGDVSRNAAIHDQVQDSLNNTIMSAVVANQAYSNRLDEVATDEVKAAAATAANKASIDAKNRSMTKANANMAAMNTQMGLMATLAERSSLEFGSLSLNVGSFNIALKQLHIQIPAILAGMGAWIALLTSLAAALALATGAIVAFMGAGFAAYVMQVEEEFDDIEDTMEAVMAIVGGIGDLFKEALEPIMGEADIDIFIGAVQKAAEVLNVFAQFFADNRDEFLGFWDEATFDLNVFLDSMMNAFRTMRPFLLDILNYLGHGLPKAIESFAEISAQLLPHIKLIVGEVRELFATLLDFSTVIIGAVAPILGALVMVLTEVFEFIEEMDKQLLQTVIAFGALAVVVAKVAGGIIGLAGTVSSLVGILSTAATGGSIFASTLMALRTAAIKAGRGELTFAQTVVLTDNILKNAIASVKSMIASKLAAGKASLVAAKGMLKTAAAAAYSAGMMVWNAAAAKMSAINMYNLGRASMIAQASLTGLIKRLYASAAALVAKGIAALSSATAMGVAAVAAKALMAALGIGLIVAVAGALYKLATGGEGASGAMERFGAVMDHVKNIVSEFLTPIINIGISLMNLVKALAGIWVALADALGLASDEGEGGASTLDSLGSAATALARALAWPLRALDFLIRLLVALVEMVGEDIKAFGDMMGDAKKETVEAIKSLDWLAYILEVVTGWLETASDWADGFAEAMDGVKESVSDATDALADHYGVQMDGPAREARAAREQQKKEEEEESEPTPRRPDVELALEDQIENNIDVDADPEEKETMRRVVKDALNEANSVARRREGHPQ